MKMKIGKQQIEWLKPHRNYLIFGFIGLIIFSALAGIICNPASVGTATEADPSSTIRITISAVGDCTLGIDDCQKDLANFDKEYKKQKDVGYFFKNVAAIFAKDDLTIANFEGTLTNSTTRADKKFAFKGSPSYIKILTAAGIDAVNLANNHTYDYGTASYKDTIATLKKAKIPYFNGPSIAIKEVNQVKVGLIGINGLYGESKKKELEEAIKACKNKKAKLIIVSFHWGAEHTYSPTSTQKKLAHWAIDYGADLVIGHHPHVLQGIEEYKDKYIIYSLGNFCFGGNTNPSDKDTMIFQQTFTFKQGKLQTDDRIKIIPCSISSVQNRNNYQPTPLAGMEKLRVLKKLNKMSKAFGIAFDNYGDRKKF